ncbi:pyrroloquinoline quinone-dependent dehydrogenase [Chitinophaga lutea]
MPISPWLQTLVLCSLLHPAFAQRHEWPAYGNDAGGMRFSPAAQITTANVHRLRPAWTYRSGELQHYEGTSLAEKAAFEATPLMRDGRLFLSTPTCRVVALDAATGRAAWTFDPQIDPRGDYSEVTSRGVSAWPANGRVQRIFLPVLDGRLIALDAGSGKPIESFGKKGSIDLREGFGSSWSITSPPAVIGNVVVVGSSIGDNQRINYPRGTVRAYDARSGNLLWSWDPIPNSSSDPAWSSWENGRPGLNGAANAWAPISADPKTGWVFIPTTCPAPDYYGGERPGDNHYANSVVAIDAATGKLQWHYQVVHHDIWDFDIPAQPLLFDLPRNGRNIPAVAVGTKMGHIFILDRRTGKPLFPVKEHTVPASNVPGEKASPTQPVPAMPAPLGLQRIRPEDAWGTTPEARAAAASRIGALRYDGPFTPPSLEGSIIAPGNVGGVHWGGMCYDPQRKLLITNINRLAAVIRLVPRDSLQALRAARPDAVRGEIGRQEGTPYVMVRDYLMTRDKDGYKLQTSPPWGTLLAVDLSGGQLRWEVPLGYMLDTTKYPEAKKWGSLNFGGAIATAGGLTFVAASMDGHLRAFNSTDGRLLWEATLPAGGQATPMTYQLNGKQYVVISAGGHGKMGTPLGDFVVAYALP